VTKFRSENVDEFSVLHGLELQRFAVLLPPGSGGEGQGEGSGEEGEGG